MEDGDGDETESEDDMLLAERVAGMVAGALPIKEREPSHAIIHVDLAYHFSQASVWKFKMLDRSWSLSQGGSRGADAASHSRAPFGWSFATARGAGRAVLVAHCNSVTVSHLRRATPRAVRVRPTDCPERVVPPLAPAPPPSTPPRLTLGTSSKRTAAGEPP